MIELRWLIRDTGRINLDGPGTIKERVLQYRAGDFNLIDRITGSEVWSGTDWQDVPTVMDDSASSESTKEK